MTDFSSVELKGSRDEVERSLTRLKVVNGLRYVSLPVAAIAAGISATTAPIAFPLVAVVTAAAVGIGEFLARKERAQLDLHLRDLEARNAVGPEELKNISSAANTFTVAGSS